MSAWHDAPFLFNSAKSDAEKCIVRWRPSPCFDVRCEIAAPLSLFRSVVSLFCADQQPDDQENCDDSNGALWRWRIERVAPVFSVDELSDEHVAPFTLPRDDASFSWRVRDLATSATFCFPDARQALTCIEYSIVQRLVSVVKTDHATNGKTTQVEAPLFAMHGALLAKNGFGLIIVGASCSGKSTLSCALWRAGWDLRSDDFSFLRDSQAFPASRRVSLRNGSRALLGDEVWARVRQSPSSAPTTEGWLFHPHEVRPVEFPKYTAVELRAIVFLGRPSRDAANDSLANAPIVLRRCDAARAAVSLLPYCTLLERPSEEELEVDVAPNRVLDWGRALSQIAPLASRVPVYDLQRAALPDMVAAVETLICDG